TAGPPTGVAAERPPSDKTPSPACPPSTAIRRSSSDNGSWFDWLRNKTMPTAAYAAPPRRLLQHRAASGPVARRPPLWRRASAQYGGPCHPGEGAVLQP